MKRMTALNRRLDQLEGGRNKPRMLVASNEAEACELRQQEPDALIVITGVPQALDINA